MVENITVPGGYLYSAFVVQSGSNKGDVLIADSSASCHMTHDRTRLYALRPPPPGREAITIEDRRKLKIGCVGTLPFTLPLCIPSVPSPSKEKGGWAGKNATCWSPRLTNLLFTYCVVLLFHTV